jgi:transposase
MTDFSYTRACAAGIDVGRDFLDVAIAPSGRWFRAPNNPAGVKLVLARLARAGALRVVLELIGPYASALMRALAGAGLSVGVVDPKRIKALRLAEGKHAKTDKLDAELIARFALIMKDAGRPLPSAESLAIRALSTRRRQIVEMIAMEKVRLKQALDEPIAQSHRAMIALLGAERARLEHELTARTRAEPGGAQRETLLRTIPGVGPAIAMTLLADLPELGKLDRKAIASLAGLAPQANQSGTKDGRAHIQGGRPCVRAAMFLAALTGVRSDKGFKREYQAMRAAGKPGKVALIAIARKMLVAANSMVANNQPWTAPNA